MALPPRVHVKIGNASIRWIDLLLVADKLQNIKEDQSSPTALRIHLELSIYLSVKKYPQLSEYLRSDPERYNNKLMTYAILTDAKEKKTTNPKDKVFALYSLFLELGLVLPKPDYRKPIEQIFREATVACLRFDKSLDILYQCPSDNRNPDLRSWVPDWNASAWSHDDSRAPLAHSRFAACGPSEAAYDFNQEETRLILVGKIFDTVDVRSRVMPGGRNLLPALRDGSAFVRKKKGTAEHGDEFFEFTTATFDVFRSWRRVADTSSYPTGEHPRDAFRSVATMDGDAQRFEPRIFSRWLQLIQSSDQMIMKAAVEAVSPGWQQAITPDLHQKFVEQCEAQIPAHQRVFWALGDEARDFHFDAVIMSEQKCFFRTAAGFFGTAPDPACVSVQAGDKVALIAGMAHPMLLRLVDGGYKLLTHVFLHGAMYGEVWPEGSANLDEIVLV